MAPEQLAGTEVTARSDLFSLGLVLYEILTGKKVFEAESVAELVRLYEQRSPIIPSSHLAKLDADTERLIIQCLETDPRRRPSSAAAVLAALPGGDPLAAALAAGETPSPEMVADAGEAGTMSPRAGAALMALTLFGILGLALLSRYAIYRRLPLERSPQELAYEARRIISNLGYTEPPAANHYYLSTNFGFLSYLREYDKSITRLDRLATGRPAAIYFRYLQSPELLLPFAPGTISSTNPPQTQPGMLSVSLDVRGRLIALRYVPDRTEPTEQAASDPDWTQLFEAAGLDPSKLTSVEPLWIPETYADARAAWTGVFPDWPDLPLRVEAAAYRGRPVYWSLQGPWVRPPARTGGAVNVPVRSYLVFALPVLVLIGGGWLARQNWHRGRVDRRGAMRLAVYVFVLHIAAWASVTHHVPLMSWELYLLRSGLGTAFYWSAIVWVTYLAIEPHVRRRWPWRIISWSRVLACRFRDPLVGKHLLIGAALGACTAPFITLYQAIPGWMGLPPYVQGSNVGALTNRLYWVLNAQILAIDETLMLVAVFLLVAMVFRKEWLATIVLIIVAMVYFGGRGTEYAWLEAVFVAVLVLAYVSIFLRLGIFPATVGLFFHWLSLTSPITTDFSNWYAVHSVAVIVLMVGLAAYGWVTSVGAQAWYRESTWLLDS